jgi:hypothetical protein
MAKIFASLDGEDWTHRTARVGLPILVEYARSGRPITYGEWDHEIVIRGIGKHVFLPEYGRPAGVIGNACMEYAKHTGSKVPMINLMVVNKDGVPGKGANYYIEEFVEDCQQRKIDLEHSTNKEKKAIIDRAHDEIFGFRRWAEMLAAYGLEPTKGTVNSGDSMPRRQPNPAAWHTGPESEAHKALKRGIAQSPQLVNLSQGQIGKEEYRLWSGDEVDVYFPKSAAGVEVKTANAGFDELHRGIFQCVKYKAVLRAQQVYDRTIPNADCVLAVGGKLPKELQDIARLLQVSFFHDLADRIS